MLNPSRDKQCWLCGSHTTRQLSTGISTEALTPDHFAITDAHYGTTLSIYQCDSCGYKFCADADDVTGYYTELVDDEYERTRTQRAIQAQYLLAQLKKHRAVGTLLDVGAGSGILVEQAQRLGFAAQGVEPCTWLTEQAQQKNIPVTRGIFPEAIANNKYDIITLIDVLEHVNRPLPLLQDIADHLNPDGIAVIVTPDVASMAAKIMGRKWWHYRVAHLSYFDKSTLTLALKKVGLEPLAWHRPTWCFPLDYLLLRLGHYLPFVARPSLLRVAKCVNVPTNLFDSWLVFARKIA